MSSGGNFVFSSFFGGGKGVLVMKKFLDSRRGMNSGGKTTLGEERGGSMCLNRFWKIPLMFFVIAQ